MPGPGLPCSAEIMVDGSAITLAGDVRLMSVRVHLAIGHTSRAEISYADEHLTMLAHASLKVGAHVEVKIVDPTGSPTSVFKGDVVGVAAEQQGMDRHRVIFEAYDQSYKLSRGTTMATYLDQSYSDIISSIAGAAGLQADVASDPLGQPVHKYILQRESNWQFIDRVTRLYGCEWWVEDGKLTVRKRPESDSAAAELTWGENVINLSYRFRGADHVSQVDAFGWNPQSKAVDTHSSPRGALYKVAATAPDASAGSAGQLGDSKMRSVTLGPTDNTDAEKIAGGYLARHGTNEVVLRGEIVGRPALKPGIHIELKGANGLNGKYYLSSVEHVFGAFLGDPDLVTKFVAGPLDNTELADLLAPRSALADQFGRVGLVVGVVSNTNDPDGLYRVKVKFPELGTQIESAWARVTMLGAGPSRGLEMMPDVNDEVIVAFEHGDLRRPVVLGSMWNGSDAPPHTGAGVESGTVKTWGIKTKSGNRVELDNETGTVYIEVEDGKQKNKLRFDESAGTLLDVANLVIKFTNQKATINIDDQGNIKIDCAKFDVNATDKITLKSPTNIELSGGSGKVAITATQVELSANGTGKFTSSGVLQLKGSMTQIN